MYKTAFVRIGNLQNPPPGQSYTHSGGRTPQCGIEDDNSDEETCSLCRRKNEFHGGGDIKWKINES